MAEVALLEVSKSYGALEAVRGLSLSIANGEFVVLLGPTGAGKTTTLRLIAGLERPDRGNVLIQGRVVTNEVPAERDVAFVFQQYSLYPHLTVYDNLAFPLRSPARRMDEKAIRRRVQQVAELLHIEQKLANRATALSGGAFGQRYPAAERANRGPADRAHQDFFSGSSGTARTGSLGGASRRSEPRSSQTGHPFARDPCGPGPRAQGRGSGLTRVCR